MLLKHLKGYRRSDTRLIFSIKREKNTDNLVSNFTRYAPLICSLAVDFVYKYDYSCQSLTVNGLLGKIPDFARDRRLGSMTKKLFKV